MTRIPDQTGTRKLVYSQSKYSRYLTIAPNMKVEIVEMLNQTFTCSLSKYFLIEIIILLICILCLIEDFIEKIVSTIVHNIW